eukprot:2435799-Pleurochrysis_carterae.AAC.1
MERDDKDTTPRHACCLQLGRCLQTSLTLVGLACSRIASSSEARVRVWTTLSPSSVVSAMLSGFGAVNRRMGVVECVKHGLFIEYPVLFEKQGARARICGTWLEVAGPRC